MSLHDMWDNSKGVENRELPDSEYTVKINSVRTDKTKNTQQPMIVWETSIIAGPVTGTLWIRRVLDTDKQFTIDRAKQDFLTLGLQPTSATMIATMQSLAGKIIAVKLSTNDKGFQNSTVLGFAQPPIKRDPIDDEIPF